MPLMLKIKKETLILLVNLPIIVLTRLLFQFINFNYKSICIGLYFLIVLSATLFYSPLMASPFLVSKWLFTLMFVILLFIFEAIFYFDKQVALKRCKRSIIFEKIVLFVCTLVAVTGILQVCNIIPMHDFFAVGNFDNLAGFSACVSLSWPFCFDNWPNKGNKEKIVIVICKAIVVISIIISQSRTGALCILLGSLLLFVHTKKKMGMVFLLLFFFLFLTCFVKTDSSKGRFFIIERSIEMGMEHPITGWGVDGFKKNYMNEQAKYFMAHPHSKYSILADGIYHPLNEYLNIFVNYGILGLAVIVILILGILFYCVRNKEVLSIVYVCIFADILLFSLFSYPFHYPFTWIMLIYSLSNIFSIDFFNSKKLIVVSAIGFLSFIPIVIRIKKEIEWGKLLYRKDIHGLSKRTLNSYRNLYTYYMENGMFLRDYAYELSCQGNLKEALQIATESQQVCGANYDVTLLLANIYRECRYFSKAIYAFDKAHYMIPSRIIPLYGKYKVYEDAGDTINRSRMANMICNMNIKIESSITQEIINEVKINRK
jgi:O-antigen ligase